MSKSPETPETILSNHHTQILAHWCGRWRGHLEMEKKKRAGIIPRNKIPTDEEVFLTEIEKMLQDIEPIFMKGTRLPRRGAMKP